ncbi:glycerol-3-phosphate dehydrogenase/oxidase [Actinomycetospora sp. TBRC 11914]|uniref:glycerol-3-phosphate dehydrogenase/oxidase n=1 Tax=Actinomycetospora sp. TBRC 11914 TaxID=2729387 RepID=UPI00145F80F4|nr:glycerol-3-phosphate dehydrogenase/oxidase [Actinomycetospora sp. TBRC 11914]NMO90820.1 glycerol-3-phosphate dehydrogenase/oxidase [Actinomycetospora sp. TBRC 11914]
MDAAAEPSRLGPAQREAAWQRLSDERFDVVVVGGGVVGVGAALDAATRGLTVALVEARDLAAGTSSRSSKLFHGGLRYLEQLDFGLVREALYERELNMTRLAPHLIKPVPFLYPLTHHVWERPYVTAGVTLYDTMGGKSSLPKQRQLTRSGALRMAPALKRDALVGAVRYYDAQADDARHTMMVGRTAAQYGAVVRTSTQVVDFLHEVDRVAGVRVRDVETGRETDVRAHVVVNCTGVWTDQMQQKAGTRGRFHVQASKGVHFLVARDKIPSDVGMILRTEKSVLFVIPWRNHWIVGTTDTDWRLDLAHPAATRHDIDYLLEHINSVLVTPLSHDDIEGVYAGLRPLLAGESEETSKLSREHAVSRVMPGMVSIAGGKYTTYRVMAKDALDAAAEDIPARVAPSITDRVPLIGADGYFALVNQSEHLGRRYGLHPHRIRHLLDRYGSLLHGLLAMSDDDRSLLEPVPGASDYLKVEVAYAVAYEGALHLDDVLTRRTRISIEYAHRGAECAASVGDQMAELLGWDDATREREVRSYVERVEAERRSQTVDTDEEADKLRVAAPDPRAERLEPLGTG